MMLTKQDARAFTIGAVGYSLIELAVRRKTHWSMAVTGGLCFLMMHRICKRHRAKSRARKCLMGAALITGMEYAVGCLVNRMMKWDVWDYSDRWFNLKGQICPRFTGYWFLLGIPMIWISDRLAKNPQK